MVVNISLREAVKHFAVSRPTLQKALKSGKISGVQDGQGHWTIDPSEVARLYHPRKMDVVKADNTLPGNFTMQNTPLPGQVEALQEQLIEMEKRAAVAEALAEERGRHIDDLRRMLPPPPAPSKRWWSWKK